MATRKADYAGVEGDYRGDIYHDSSTDVSESLMDHHGHEKSWNDIRNAARPRPSRARRCCSAVLLQGLLNTVLLLLVLGLLLDRRWHQDRYGQLEGSGDITGFIPSVAQQIKTFVPDMAFVPENGSDFFTETVQQKWLSIVPSSFPSSGLFLVPPRA